MAFQAEPIFEMMATGLAADPSIGEKLKAVFVYRLSKGAEKKVWTADLKAGKVFQGEPEGKADVEFTMSDDDFAALVSKKANPQSLFMSGKLKLKGNMALAMKFEQLLKGLEAQQAKPAAGAAAKPAAAGSKKAPAAEKKGAAPAAEASSDFKSAALFNQLSAALKADPSLVEKLKSVFVYKLTKGGQTQIWTIDLKNGKGAIHQGEPKIGKADVEFTLADDDFVALVSKKANPQSLFMSGKLKLKGNMALAMKFETVLKALPTSKL